MKNTGIIRRIDELGRIVLPAELRRMLEIEERDAMEIFVDEDKIVLRKYQESCIFCGAESELVEHRGKRICKACLAILNESSED